MRNIPNLISLMRLLLVPLTVWLIISEAYGWAFTTFLVAGISDGIDGYPGPPLRLAHQARRLSRSAGRQGAAGVGLRDAGLPQADPGLARHHSSSRATC